MKNCYEASKRKFWNAKDGWWSWKKHPPYSLPSWGISQELRKRLRLFIRPIKQVWDHLHTQEVESEERLEYTCETEELAPSHYINKPLPSVLTFESRETGCMPQRTQSPVHGYLRKDWDW